MGEGSSRRRSGSSVAAAALVDRRAALVALRDKLAADIDEASPAVVAQIAGQLRAVLKDLADLGDEQKVSDIDEIAARRKARRSATAV